MLQRCRQKMERLVRPENEAAKQQHLLLVTSPPNILPSICSIRQHCHRVEILSDGSLQSEASVPLCARKRGSPLQQHPARLPCFSGRGTEP